MNLYCSDDSFLSTIQELAAFSSQINCLVINAENIMDSTYLFYDASGLNIISSEFKTLNLKEFYNDFIAKRSKILTKENLLQALNYGKLKNVDRLSALDLTGGLGRDALIFALAGFDVTVVERNIYLACILKYLAVIAQDFISEFNVIYQDSQEYLTTNDKKFTCIYYDPMFEDNKKALSKKDMQLIDLFVHLVPAITSQENNLVIYQLAKQSCHKLVVKRDNKQEFFVKAIKPTYQKIGKTVRFDVYQGDVPLSIFEVN